MSELQSIEYKSVWKYEFLKWICGFANAQGGKIFIGKEDNGIITSLKDSKQLFEIIPLRVKPKTRLSGEIKQIKHQA
jgi:ATP-dependent DNA helicase RecG